MAKIYSDEQIDFIRKIAPGKWNAEIADLFNKKFGMSLTAKKITSIKKNHNIISGMRGKRTGKEPKNKIFTDEISEFIHQHYIGIGNIELTEMINKQFQTTFVTSQIKAYKARHKLDSGINGYFEPGQEAFNKGMKQSEYMSRTAIERTKSTRFQKGQKPQNYKPVGTERVDRDGYVLVKVQDDGEWHERWRHKSRVVWEKENGPVPDGYTLVFLDRNRENCSVGNLRLVSRAELARINQNDLLTDDIAINEVALNIAKLMTRTSELRR